MSSFGVVGNLADGCRQRVLALVVEALVAPQQQVVADRRDQLDGIAEELVERGRRNTVFVAVLLFFGLFQAHVIERVDPVGKFGSAGHLAVRVVQPGDADAQQLLRLDQHRHDVGVGAHLRGAQLLDQMLDRRHQRDNGLYIGHVGADLESVQRPLQIVGLLGRAGQLLRALDKIFQRLQVGERFGGENIQQRAIAVVGLARFPRFGNSSTASASVNSIAATGSGAASAVVTGKSVGSSAGDCSWASA